MTKFELTEFLTWMTNHQPSSKQVMDEMYVHDVALVMQTVRDEFTRLQAERDEARILACKGLALEAHHTRDKIGSNIWRKTALTPQEMADERKWDCFKEETT